jgi:hypothetical protein
MTRVLIRPLLGILAGLGLAGTSQAAGVIGPDQAPPAWVAYAEGSTRTVAAWLNAETAPAPRIRAVLDATRPAQDQPTPPLLVKLWVDGQGIITRADIPSLGDAAADQDLQSLLVGHALTAPPKGLRLPMRLALQLPPSPPPEEEPQVARGAPAGATVH